MSCLRVVHETTYRYSEPVHFGPHRLVLRPREGHDLRVEEMTLQISPDYDLEWSRDLFGNSVATAYFFAPADVLNIKSTLLLNQTSAFPRRTDRPVQRPKYPLQFSPLEENIAAAYRASTFPGDVERVAAWLRSEVDPSTHADAETLAAAVNQKVRRAIGYRRREEKGVQSPGETLAAGSGSCRDLAALVLECWRALGFPARFASGYLDCTASEAGRASTHAWAEVYLPEVGWIGFDPTLGALTSSQHVVTGVSNHPRGVMPITGTFFGERTLYEGMEVSVKTRRVEHPNGGPQGVAMFRPPPFARDAA
ncbi:MAG: transglutaminase family protein [Chthoniobacteraceae bacterium]